MVLVSKITTVLSRIFNFASIMQIPSAENTDEQHNLTICVRDDHTTEANNFDPGPYFTHSINMLLKDLSCLKSYASSSTEKNNNQNTYSFQTFLSKVQTIEIDLEKWCPKNALDTHEKIQNIKKEFLSVLQDCIVKSISLDKFSTADEQLQLTGGDYNVNENIVKEVYNYTNLDENETSGFIQILNFALFIPNTERKFKLFDAIYRVLKSNDDANTFKLLVLHGDLMREVVNLPGINGTKGRELICKLWEENREEAINILSTVLLNDGQWPTAEKTKEDIRNVCSDFLYNVTGDVIEKVYGKIDLRRLWEKITLTVDDIREKIISHETIINKVVLDKKLNDYNVGNKVELDKKLNNYNAVPMVHHMKLTWDDPELNNVPTYWRKRYRNVTDKLPNSLRNVILFSPICIKNSLYGEYLYADDPEYTVIDPQYRKIFRLVYKKYHEVFTRIPKDEYKSDEFKWKVGFFSHSAFSYIVFYNVKYNGSLDTYSPIAGNYTKGIGILESDLPHHSSRKFWLLRVDENGVEMSRFQRGYRLLVDGSKLNNDTRYVFYGNPPPWPTGKPEYSMKWELIDCSDSS